MKLIEVMVVGLSRKWKEGKMAKLIAEAIDSQPDMHLHLWALSEESGEMKINGKLVNLAPTKAHKAVLLEKKPDLIIDCTLPRSVNSNAELYCETRRPFVMLTTGGDRKQLARTIKGSKISALLTVNAAAEVVVMQEMFKYAAKKFPGIFRSFSRLFYESHQAGKKDSSGTMIANLDYFSALLGAPVSKDEIKMVRDPAIQEMELGIPKEHLGGHAYHTYTLRSADGAVMIQFKHNLLGRQAYVNGALLDIRYMTKHLKEKGKVYTQVDALMNR